MTRRAQNTARQIMDRATSEDELLIAITEALTLYSWRWTHARRSDRALMMGHSGVPDIIALRAGRVKFIELKKEGEQPTAEQWAWLDACLPFNPNVTAHVWRPSDLTAALRELT